LSAAADTTRERWGNAEVAPPRRRGPWVQAAHRFRRRRLGIVALGVLLLVVLAGVLAPVIAPHSPTAFDFQATNHGPTLAGTHLFGTDQLGRDTLSRTLYAIRASTAAAIVVALLATALGIVVGALAGYYGGAVDNALMRIVDLIVSVPAMGVLFAAIVFLGAATPKRVSQVLILYLWTAAARVIRSTMIAEREHEYVEAARAAGASDARIVVRHLVPNALGPIIVGATALFGQAILLEAMVEFFSFGVDSNRTPTLGNLIADATKYTGLDPLWWLYTFPAIVLVVLLVCVNFVGDTLDEAFAPTRS
jgi:ABC-type dipeptide/oligopeptide/nickel transport system permease subunit